MIVVRFLLAVLGRELVAHLWQLVATLALTVFVVIATVIWSLGVMAQPGGIYWLAAQAPPELQAQHPLRPLAPVQLKPETEGNTIVFPAPPVVGVPAVASAPVLAPGAVSDVDRARLAMAAGWTGNDLVIAVAVSIAEDPAGNPAALSPVNRNGTRDLGLWQINSGWWPQFGGQAALIVPINNANAGFWIWSHTSSWCAWSTYEERCGAGYVGTYRQYLPRASGAVRLATGG